MKAGLIRCPTCGHGFSDIESDYDMGLEYGDCTESRVYGTCKSGHPLAVRLTREALEVAAGPLKQKRRRE